MKATDVRGTGDSRIVSSRPDKIIVSAINCIAAVGVTPQERQMKQRLSVDVEVTGDLRAAAASDSIEDTLDYAEIVSLVTATAEDREYDLIETIAERIARGVLKDLGGQTVRVLVRKMTSPLSARVGFVAVEVFRESDDAS